MALRALWLLGGYAMAVLLVPVVAMLNAAYNVLTDIQQPVVARGHNTARAYALRLLALLLVTLPVNLIAFLPMLMLSTLTAEWGAVVMESRYYPWIGALLYTLPVWRSPTQKLRAFAGAGDVAATSRLIGLHAFTGATKAAEAAEASGAVSGGASGGVGGGERGGEGKHAGAGAGAGAENGARSRAQSGISAQASLDTPTGGVRAAVRACWRSVCRGCRHLYNGATLSLTAVAWLSAYFLALVLVPSLALLEITTRTLGRFCGHLSRGAPALALEALLVDFARSLLFGTFATLMAALANWRYIHEAAPRPDDAFLLTAYSFRTPSPPSKK